MTTKPSPTLTTSLRRHLLRTLLISWGIIAGLVVLGLILYFRTDKAYSQSMQKAEDLQERTLALQNELVNEVLNTRAYLITGEERSLTKRQLAHEALNRDLELVKEAQAGLGTTLEALPVLVDLHNQYDKLAEDLVALREAGQTGEMMNMFFARSDPLVIAFQDASRQLQGEVQDEMAAASMNFSRSNDRVITLIGVIFLLASTLTVLMLVQVISPPLNQLEQVENALLRAAETQVYHPLELSPGSPGSGVLVAAHNQLISRMEQSNAAILKFVSFLHHEINSLLASVSGYGYMLAEPSLRPQEADIEEYGRVIVQQTRRVTRLVEDFTLAAKLEGNQFAPSLLPIRLEPLLEMVIQEVEDDSEREGLHRRISYHPTGEPLLTLGDSLSLEMAFRKLLENAVKFSPEGSEINVIVSTTSAPCQALVHILDRGMGIAESDLPLLFRPFSRIKNDATRRIPGNGMGLFLSSAIIRYHHGNITVRSTPGTGSVFTVALPMEDR
jgi:signal transduction histidine kinase